MKSVKEKVITEFIVNKSTFINYLIPVDSIDDVLTEMNALRKEYNDANHHCYAYIIGENQEIQKYSDDGEPSKTAGMPMMEVLKKHDLTNVLNVSIRYFGGIKLGAGGLVRAYTKSCANSINEAVFSTLTEFNKLEVIISFDMIGNIEKFIRDSYNLVDQKYDNNVHYFIELEKDLSESFTTSTIEKTNGKGIVKILDSYRKYI